MRNLSLLSLCLALVLLRASYANEKLVIFGDSLSDNGNALALTGGTFPPSPYGYTYNKSGKDLGDTFPGRFTDGGNWVDYFPRVAKCFGVVESGAPAYFQNIQNANATNFAVGGATSGEGNVFINGPLGFQSQIATYLQSVGQQASADCLYVIWIGANDFSAGIDPAQTVANIENGIAELSAKGARTFLVMAVPDLSLTPQVRAFGGATVLAAKRFVLTTNVLLEVKLPQFALSHQISIELVDINEIFVPLVYNPRIFGFTNSTGAAFNLTTPVVVSDPNDYVFWDGFHTTTNVHYIAAEFIFKAAFLRPQFHNFLSIR
jgi:phospholipase/lecithinase/hemolysin